MKKHVPGPNFVLANIYKSVIVVQDPPKTAE